jgi:hypothetical protein
MLAALGSLAISPVGTRTAGVRYVRLLKPEAVPGFLDAHASSGTWRQRALLADLLELWHRPCIAAPPRSSPLAAITAMTSFEPKALLGEFTLKYSGLLLEVTGSSRKRLGHHVIARHDQRSCRPGSQPQTRLAGTRSNHAKWHCILTAPNHR